MEAGKLSEATMCKEVNPTEFNKTLKAGAWTRQQWRHSRLRWGSLREQLPRATGRLWHTLALAAMSLIVFNLYVFAIFCCELCGP